MRKSSEDGNGCADAESLDFVRRSDGLGLIMLLKSSILGRGLAISRYEYSENFVGKTYDSHAIYLVLRAEGKEKPPPSMNPCVEGILQSQDPQ